MKNLFVFMVPERESKCWGKDREYSVGIATEEGS